MYALLAIHHPVEHRLDGVLAAMQTILDGIDSAGLKGGFVGVDRGRCEVFALTLWDDPAQFDAVFPAIQVAVEDSGILQWLARPSRALKFLEVPHTA